MAIICREPQRESLRALLEELYQERNLRYFRAGQSIPLCRDDVWIIYRGMVQVQTIHPSGDESIISLIGPMMPLAQKFTTLESYDTYALTDVDDIHLTHQQIANVLGVTRVTVTRFLGILRQASLFWLGEDRRWHVSPRILDSHLNLSDFGFP